MQTVRFVFFCLWTAIWAGTATANAAEDALAASQALQDAAEQLDRAQSAKDRVKALTETVQAYEQGLVALRDGLRRASIREQALTKELDTRQGEIAALLAVLQTMGRAQTTTLLLHPLGPTGTARSGMILSDVTPALNAKTEQLKSDLSEVATLRTLQESAVDTLRNGLEGAQSARSALSKAITERTDLPKRYIENPVETAVLLASVDTLDGFASGLSQIGGGDEENLPELSEVLGDLPLPVAGTILRKYNEADAAGIVRPGLLIATRPAALVTSPMAATIRYSGDLLNYGNVVILEPATDALLILAGLDTVYGDIGDVLPAGSPVGLMGGSIDPTDGNLTKTLQDSGLSRTETLYIETRLGSDTQDPTTWFTDIRE